jgi:hypothetical protein
MQFIDNFGDCFVPTTALSIQAVEDQIFSQALAATCPPDLPPTKVSSNNAETHA